MKHKIKTETDLSRIYEEASVNDIFNIYLKNGSIATGNPYAYTSSINNTPEVPEIDIKNKDGSWSGFLLPDIDSIEIIKES